MAHLAGGSVHGVIAAAGASVQTAKSRKKEKAFGKTGGLKGFSRTKANKDVTETWSGAVVGTGASIGGGMAAYAAGAVVGQALIPVPGVGAAVGGAIGGVLGGVIGGIGGGKGAKAVSGKVFEKNISRKCPLC